MRNETHVPEGWELRSLDGLIERSDETRGELEPEPTVLSCSKDLGLVPQMELFQRRLASTDTRRYKLVHPGNFVYDPNLLWSGAISRSHEQGIGIVSPVYEVFRTKQHCSREFLFAWLKSPARLSQYRAISMGTNVRRRRADFSDFSKLQVLLPPTHEQRAIAVVLDSIDEAIERTEAVVAATERLRDALLHELLTRGVPGWHTEWKNAPGIGAIPACWEVKRLRDVLADGPTNGIYKPESEYGTGTWLIRINDFIPGALTRQDGFERIRVSDEESEHYAIYSGDVLINRVNSLSHLGKAVLVPKLAEPTLFESNMMRLRMCSEVEPGFAMILLLSRYARQYFISRAKKAVQQASINQQDVTLLPIPLPGNRERTAILETSVALNDRILRDGTALERLKALKASAADALLTGRVRVKQSL